MIRVLTYEFDKPLSSFFGFSLTFGKSNRTVEYQIAGNFRRTNISLIKFYYEFNFRTACVVRKFNVYEMFTMLKNRTHVKLD